MRAEKGGTADDLMNKSKPKIIVKHENVHNSSYKSESLKFYVFSCFRNFLAFYVKTFQITAFESEFVGYGDLINQLEILNHFFFDDCFHNRLIEGSLQKKREKPKNI